MSTGIVGTVKRIVIFMVPRSGSSMVTSIFHAHGLWVGRCEAINKFGYYSFENVDMRNKLRDLVTPDIASPARMKVFHKGNNQDSVRKAIGHIATDWVYKTGIDNWCLFDGLYDDIKFVFVKRKIDFVVASIQDKEDSNYLHSRKVLEAKYAVMDELSASSNIPIVYSDELIDGKYVSLERAFAYCGLAFDSEIADLMIKPEQWKHA